MGFSARSEQTRSTILAAARTRFAAEGYDATTIRAIAADADIDPSMVMRYYGSKDGLFAAAIDVELHLPDLTQQSRQNLGQALMRQWVEIWERDRSNELLHVLLRSAITNEQASERLRTVFGNQVLHTIASVVDNPDEAPTRAGLVASQMLGLALTRHILKLPPVVAIDAETLVASVAPTIQRYITGTIDIP